jgi:hypothetical protein
MNVDQQLQVKGPLGHGTVFIAGDDGRYGGYWDLEPDGPPTMLEQMPEFITASDAVRWGRARADRVLIRPRSDPARYHWAGAIDPPADQPMPSFEDERDALS